MSLVPTGSSSDTTDTTTGEFSFDIEYPKRISWEETSLPLVFSAGSSPYPPYVSPDDDIERPNLTLGYIQRMKAMGFTGLCDIIAKFSLFVYNADGTRASPDSIWVYLRSSYFELGDLLPTGRRMTAFGVEVPRKYTPEGNPYYACDIYRQYCRIVPSVVEGALGASYPFYLDAKVIPSLPDDTWTTFSGIVYITTAFRKPSAPIAV